MDGDLWEIIHDAQTNEKAGKIAATRASGIGAHLSVPSHSRDGSFYDTFCEFDNCVEATLNECDPGLWLAGLQYLKPVWSVTMRASPDRANPAR